MGKGIHGGKKGGGGDCFLAKLIIRKNKNDWLSCSLAFSLDTITTL